MTDQPAKRARVKIVSDGTRAGTHVTVNGTPLEGVTAITWQGDVSMLMAEVSLTLLCADVDLEGDLIETLGRRFS